jgi:O-antigen/teichoic acid export membrane protein
MFSNILDIGYSSLAYFLLKRKFGFLEVGALNRARYFPDILNSFYLSFFGRVLFTDISNFKKNDDDLRLHYSRSVRISYIFYSQVIVTIGVFYFFFSQIFIGKANQYEDFKLILFVFFLSTFLYILDAINLIFLRALGQINIFFKVEIVKKIVFSTILLTIPLSSLLSISILLFGLLILSSFVSSFLVYLSFGGFINRMMLLDFSLFIIILFISQLDIELFLIAPIYLLYSIYNVNLFIQMKRYFQ